MQPNLPSSKPALKFNCQEPWDKMIPVDGGHHCGACSKTVIDLTHYSNEELKSLIAGGKVHCGRVTADQIEAPVSNPVSFSKRWFFSLTALIFARLFTQAQETSGDSIFTAVDPDKKILAKNKALYGDSTVFHLTGIVKGRKGKAMSHSSVTFMVNGVRKGMVYTDDKGKFDTSVPLANGGESLVLRIKSGRKYKEKMVTVDVGSGDFMEIRVHRTFKNIFKRQQVHYYGKF
jgi:hypothetical protein